MSIKFNKQVFLPGSGRQITFLAEQEDPTGKDILLIGAGTDGIAKFLRDRGNNVIVIIDDQDNLLQMRYVLTGQENISVRMMEFENTDFRDGRFDIVYAQASVSTIKRNKIVKEVKRLLLPGGIFCAGEIVNLKDSVPQFVTDVWEQSGLSPLFINDLNKYYTERGFIVKAEEDISSTLTNFYSLSSDKLKNDIAGLTEEELIYHKKLLKKISHESNVYLRLGGNTYMGYKILLLRKA